MMLTAYRINSAGVSGTVPGSIYILQELTQHRGGGTLSMKLSIKNEFGKQ